MNRVQLFDYARRAGILVAKSASREEIEAAIVRALMHASDVEPSPGIGCFGLWADDDATCLTCSYQEECSTASLGQDLEKAKRTALTADEIRILTAPLRKKSRKRKRK